MVNLSRIKDLCEANNITIKQLAKDLGLSERAMHSIISLNTTKIATLESISEYFKVNISYFFTTGEKELERYARGVLASSNFQIVYDIWRMFRVEEEMLLSKDESLKQFLNANLSQLSTDTARSDVFSLAFNNELILRLYNSLDRIDEKFSRELITILIDLIQKTYVVLENGHSLKIHIEQGAIKNEDVKYILKTYFDKFSITNEIYKEMIACNSSFRYE